MARIRIEWVPIESFGLGLLGFDHLQLVFQPASATVAEQGDWYVMEGTRDGSAGLPYAVLGVLGDDGFTSLNYANPVLDNGDYRLPTAQELIDSIGTPFSRGSRALPIVDAFNAWQTMATFAQEIEQQQLPYLASGFAATGLPTINSTSVVASLLHYVGLDLGSYFPYGMRMSPGRTTLIGTTKDDEMQIEGAFTTLVGGLGEDIFRGTNASSTESFYGGRGNDVFRWSEGYNIYHGGQPYLDYTEDGTDTIIYEGVGDIFIRKNQNAIPHIFPDYYVNYSSGFDWMFSVERLQWNTTTDHIHLESGLEIIEDGLIIDLNGEGVNAPANTKGDTLDLSQTSDGLLINAAQADAVFITDVTAPTSLEGLWLEEAEWIIASEGSDHIYLANTMRGAEGGAGDDIIDARLVTGSAGTGPNGYELELSGGQGDDIIVAGRGVSYVEGGSGADTFVLSTMTGRADAIGTVEFIIADADSNDQLLVPYNYFNESDGDFEGSELLPVLGALGNYSDMTDNGWQLYFEWLTEADYWFGSDFTSGMIDFVGGIEYSVESDDLVIRFFSGESVTTTEVIDDVGNTITYTDNAIDPATETIVRVVDFTEGDLGLEFHDLGDPESIDLGNGQSGTTYPNFDSAVAALTNNGNLLDPLDPRPTPPATNPNEDGGSSDPPEVLVGSSGDDVIIATSETSDITGGDGDDTLTGGSGDDILDGGPGVDTLQGGTGDDTYIVDNTADTIVEQSGGGTDSVLASVNYTLSAHVEHLTLTAGAITATGNAEDNRLIGNEADNTLNGFAGSDSLYGSAGNDTLAGGDGNDSYAYQIGDGDDVIIDTGPSGGIDELLLAGTVTQSDLFFARRSDATDDLVILFSVGGRLFVEDYFTATDAGIDAIVFPNGDRMERVDIETLALATDVTTNDPPQALDDVELFVRGGATIIPASVLLANDRDFDGDAISITGVGPATGGTATLLPSGDIDIVVTPGFDGELTFTYTISDTSGATDTAQVALAVMPDNLAPVAGDDTGFEIADIDTLTLDSETLLANDIDLDGDEISITGVTNAVNGTVAIDANGTVTFSPTPAYSGPASFDYTISDGEGASATATVSLDVNAVSIITGTSGADTLTGTSGWDRLEGLDGNDTITGEDGSDELYGDAGGDDLFGGSGADFLDGGSGNDVLYGGGNFDVLIGGNNGDELYGEAGNDTLDGGSGNDLLDGGTGTDTLSGGKGADTIFGGDGTDFVYGGDGADIIDGQNGKDRLYGESADDTIYGGDGDDDLWGGGGFDALNGGAGNDMLDGEAGNDLLFGDDGDDDLIGGSGTDALEGGAGDDTLDGGTGSDSLDGGDGDDILTGGNGSDTFVFRPGYGHDVITDAALASAGSGQSDLIDLSDFGYSDFASLLQDTSQSGNDTVITIDTQTSLTLEGIQVSALSESDVRIA